MDTRPARPALQLVVRACLWVALAVGCLGGVVALLKPAGGAATAAGPPATDRGAVPAPVAGVAELAVTEWLTASAEERDDLAGLFAEPPAAAPSGVRSPAGVEPRLAVRQAATVGGQRLADGYWSVTVVVDLMRDRAAAVEGTGPGAGEQADPTALDPTALDPATGEVVDEPQSPDRPARWYLQVGIVRDGGSGYLALATPSVVPPPRPGDPELAVGGTRETADPDDHLAATVERFLDALLAGTGDPAPYFTPGAEVAPADPPPFEQLSVTELTVEELDGERRWVLAHVLATTAEGVRLPLTYDLVVVARGDRWEVEELSGVPTLVE